MKYPVWSHSANPATDKPLFHAPTPLRNKMLENGAAVEADSLGGIQLVDTRAQRDAGIIRKLQQHLVELGYLSDDASEDELREFLQARCRRWVDEYPLQADRLKQGSSTEKLELLELLPPKWRTKKPRRKPTERARIASDEQITGGAA